MTILVVASRNAGKIAEIRRLLDDVGLEIELKSVAEFDLPDVEETGDSFEANALLKARTIAVATGYPAIADDSGLAVDALDGAPGIFSARWSGSHGNDR
ncbi:MAG: dITP/XTP pyrophosphatase, partial [Actinomycetota bacterium]